MKIKTGIVLSKRFISPFPPALTAVATAVRVIFFREQHPVTHDRDFQDEGPKGRLMRKAWRGAPLGNRPSAFFN